MTVLADRLPSALRIVPVTDLLRRPQTRELRHSVRTLLRSGVRAIALDLSRVSRIDAAGVGELVRAYTMTCAVDGSLGIINVSAWVRTMLERAGLLALLSVEDDPHGSQPHSAGSRNSRDRDALDDSCVDADSYCDGTPDERSRVVN